MEQNRITAQWIRAFGTWLVLAVLSVSCASTDQQAGYEDEYGDNYGDSYGDEYSNNAAAEEGGENVNNAAGNEYAYDDEYSGDNYGGNYGEGVNNYSYNEFENGGEEIALDEEGYANELDLGGETNYDYTNATTTDYGEYTNNADETADDLLAQNAGLNLTNDAATEVPANVGNYTGDVAPVNAAMDAPALDAPVNAATPLPASGGVVKYVRETTNLLDAPNGQTIASAMQGEHPVVWDEGNFHRDAKGRYIPSAALSATGIGRPRDGGAWRSSGGGGY